MNPIPVYAENIIYTDTAIETETCSICLDNMDLHPTHTINECNHKFHSSCLIESLRRNSGCPLCRGQTEIIHNINNRMKLRHILSFSKSKRNKSTKLKRMVKQYETLRDKHK